MLIFTCAAQGRWLLVQSWLVPQGQSPRSLPQQEPEDIVGKLWMNEDFVVWPMICNGEAITGVFLHKDHMHLLVWKGRWWKHVSGDIIYVRTLKPTQKVRNNILWLYILMILTRLFIAFELCYGDIDISKGAQFASLPRSLRDPGENQGPRPVVCDFGPEVSELNPIYSKIFSE